MSLHLISIILVLSAASGSIAQDSDDLEKTCGKVIFSSALFRHGDRTINEPYPNDPYQLPFWTDGQMELTKIGKEHEYELGKWFRNRYESLLKEQPYTHDFLIMNSSDTDRTLMSAELFLAGMFPPSDEELWSDDHLRWQPIPVHTLPSTCDNIIALEAHCDRYDLELDIINNSPEFAAFYREHAKLIDYVASRSGITVSTEDIFHSINNLWNVYDDLLVEESFNLTLPKWSKEIYPQPLKSVGEFYFSTIAYTLEMRKLKGGPMLKAMIEDMKTKRDNSNWNRTFHFYSGHDSTVSVFLSTLDIYDGLAPPYSAAVIVELRQKNDDHFVTVLYKNSSTTEPYLLEIPGCSTPCSLDKFITVTIPVVPDDWNYECSIGFFRRFYFINYLDITVLVCIGILLAALIIIIVQLHCARVRRYKHYRHITDNVLNHYSNGSE